MSGCAAPVELRRLQYRLRRLGMLELELWLQHLEPALRDTPELMADVEALVARDVSELEAMMRGEMAVPACLRAWLCGGVE